MLGLARSSYKSAKSYFKPPENNNISWLSVLVLFKAPELGLVLDTGYIFIGDIPDHKHAYYINFINWTVQGTKLKYNQNLFNKRNKKISSLIHPKNIHLHCKSGNIAYSVEDFLKDPTHYYHFFPSEGNKIYRSIQVQMVPEKIKIIDFTNKYPPLSKKSPKDRVKNLQDDRFLKYQIYGNNMDHKLFSGINIKYL